jgi:DNA-binding transcriptional regulator YdaS (Cro superfamily)
MPRPKANIDWDKVDKYLQAQCEGTAIASLLGVHPNTLYESCKELHKISFSEYSAIKKGEGKELLRAKMFKEAMDGDRTIQIWLSKQYLGMKDKSELKSEISTINIQDCQKDV